MGKLIGILILVGGFLTWRHWRKLPSQQARRKFGFQAIVGGLLLVIILLAMTGRIHPLGAIFAVLIPVIKVGLNLLIRGLPIFAKIYGANYAKPRTLCTELLEVTFNLATGTVSGKVLTGENAGMSLDNLTSEQINDLLDQCKNTDKKSAYLLQMYIAYRFHQSNKHSNNQQHSSDVPQSGQMSIDEAADILGIVANAPPDEISQAHRRLIGKVHPDKGGNHYLASLLNQARDLLMEQHK